MSDPNFDNIPDWYNPYHNIPFVEPVLDMDFFDSLNLHPRLQLQAGQNK